MLSLEVFTSPVAQATLPVVVEIDWHIGDVIVKLRKRARMNQTALASKVGVNKATIVRAEDGDGKVSRATYLKIALVLKTDIAALEGEAARLQAEQSDAIRQPRVSESPNGTTVSPESTANRMKGAGPLLAPVDTRRPDGQIAAVSGTSDSTDRRVSAAANRLAREVRKAKAVGQPPRAARSARQPTAATRRPAAGSDPPDRKPRR